MSVSGGPAWEYKFVDIGGDRKEYEKVITQNGRDGWEFCESNRMKDGNKDVLVLVFKKPRGSRSTFGGGAMGGMGMFGGGGGGLWWPRRWNVDAGSAGRKWIWRVRPTYAGFGRQRSPLHRGRYRGANTPPQVHERN
jgi:hypothetical protein